MLFHEVFTNFAPTSQNGGSFAERDACLLPFAKRGMSFHVYCSNKKAMSLSKYESQVKLISQPQKAVYERFADLNNLSSIKERLSDPQVQARMSEQISAEKLADLKSYVDSMSFDADSLQIQSPLGEITLRIIERDEPKCLKFASVGAPIQLYVWVQLLPHGEAETKMKVTVGAEVNVFLKGMVAKPLQQAAEGLANMLSAVR